MRRYKRLVCFFFTQLMKDFYIQFLDNICLLTMQRFVKTKNTIIHQHNNSLKKIEIATEIHTFKNAWNEISFVQSVFVVIFD